MLFVHALLGCDTTSRVYGIGTPTALKKSMTNDHFRKQAEVFESAAPTVEELVTAGEQALVYVHDGKVLLLPATTASGFIIRSNSGNDQIKFESHWIVKGNCLVPKMTALQRQPICCRSSVVTARTLFVYGTKSV